MQRGASMPRMQRRRLGDTGLTISSLGYGASPLGSMYGPIDETAGERAVRLALDLGVDFIDVAPFYGKQTGGAEEVLGRALAAIPRERFVIATKVGRYGARDFDFSAARITAGVEDSLRRLRLDHVDLLQLHDLEFLPLADTLDSALPTLERLRAQGKFRFLGITGFPLSIYPLVMERAKGARIDTILSYCHWCLSDTSLGRLLPYFERRRVGVINASPLAMGLHHPGGPPSWHPAPEETRAAAARAAEHCRTKGKDLSELALAYSLADPRIATTLVGMANEDEVRRNVAAAAKPLDAELLAEVLAILAPVRDRGWPSGRPEYAVDPLAAIGAGA
jgi:L-galactose dehydrogenase